MCAKISTSERHDSCVWGKVQAVFCISIINLTCLGKVCGGILFFLDDMKGRCQLYPVSTYVQLGCEQNDSSMCIC